MKTVLANGVWDGLHIGHVLHLREAKAMGDILVVSVTRDPLVNKGPVRPVFTDEHRAEVLRELRCVDHVIVVSSAMEALMWIRPAVFAKGPDYSMATIETGHRNFCKENAVEIRFTTGEKFSSTAWIERLRA